MLIFSRVSTVIAFRNHVIGIQSSLNGPALTGGLLMLMADG